MHSEKVDSFFFVIFSAPKERQGAVFSLKILTFFLDLFRGSQVYFFDKKLNIFKVDYLKFYLELKELWWCITNDLW